MNRKHFLIVGGTRGIGRVLVNHLLKNGDNNVSVLGRSASFDIQSANLSYYSTDVSNKKALLFSLDKTVESNGKLDCVVFLQRHRHRAKEDEFDLELEVALKATKNTIDRLIERDYLSTNRDSSSIVLVSSIADRYIAPEQPLGYHLGKAGISQLSRYYALALGPRGIRVNTVSPCVVVKEEASEFYERNKWLVSRFEKFIPLGRVGNPQDIVNVIMYLSSDQASYITGQNIVVDGGLTLRSHESLIRDVSKEEEI